MTVCGGIPAAVANFYEFQNILCALDLLFLETHNLHLLFPVLKYPQFRFAIEQVKHLPINKNIF